MRHQNSVHNGSVSNFKIHFLARPLDYKNYENVNPKQEILFVIFLLEVTIEMLCKEAFLQQLEFVQKHQMTTFKMAAFSFLRLQDLSLRTRDQQGKLRGFSVAGVVLPKHCWIYLLETHIMPSIFEFAKSCRSAMKIRRGGGDFFFFFSESLYWMKHSSFRFAVINVCPVLVPS